MDRFARRAAMRQACGVQGRDRIVDAALAVIEDVIVGQGQKVNAAFLDGCRCSRRSAIEDQIERVLIAIASLRQHRFEIGNHVVVALQRGPYPIEQVIVPVSIAVGSYPVAYASKLIAEKEIA